MRLLYRLFFKETITNTNGLKEAIRNLLDLKLINKIEIDEILMSGEIRYIISDSKSNKRQKGEKICNLIKSMRYPSIRTKEDEFDKSCKELRLDNDVRVNHSRYFEGDEIRIMLKVASEEKLGNNLERLLQNSKNDRFRKLFSIIK